MGNIEREYKRRPRSSRESMRINGRSGCRYSIGNVEGVQDAPQIIAHENNFRRGAETGKENKHKQLVQKENRGDAPTAFGRRSIECRYSILTPFSVEVVGAARLRNN